MTRAVPIPRDVAKEIRSLAVPLLACLSALIAARMLEGYRIFFEIWIPVYILGATALGAWSIGQEYVYGTLPWLFAQPIPRRRLLLAKVGALAAAELALWASATALGFRNGPRVPDSETLAFGLLPVLGGLFVAPWLTIVYRNLIAGTVFTVAVPGILLTGTQLVYFEFYRQAMPSGRDLTVLFWGSLLFCGVGAFMSRRSFMQLEAPDGSGPQPSWLERLRLAPKPSTRADGPARQNVILLLIKKELRLQSISFVVAACYLLGWITFVAYWSDDPQGDDVLTALTLIYSAVVPMLMGSLASAEERQLGTLEWQALLPVAVSKQWAVKVATTLCLAFALAIGWPAMLLSLNPGLQSLDVSYPAVMAGVALFMTISLYVSTLSGDGLRAMLASVAAVFAALVIVTNVANSLISSAVMVTARLWAERRWQRAGLSDNDLGWLMMILELAIVAAILVVVLRFAAANHRSAERVRSRAWTQVIRLAVCLITGSILLAAAAALAY